MAVRQWFQVSNSSPSDPFFVKPSLEKSLAAFDMFVLYDQRGDLDEVSRILVATDVHSDTRIQQTSQLLDKYAEIFKNSQPDWEQKSTRQRALALNQWIRSSNLAGLRNQQLDYRNLRNCFIGQALRDPKHESIPIISCAIYCSIAERVSLQAECFLAPVCVHVVVTAPNGYDLDMNRSDSEHQMYLDPFGTDGDVPVDRLEHLVSHADMSIASLRNSGTVLAISTRTAHNIQASYAAGSRRADPLAMSRLIHGHAAVNRQLARYATHWALLVLQTPFTRTWVDQRTQLLQQILHDWPEDEWIMSQYVLMQGQRTGSDVAMQHMEMFVMNQVRRTERSHAVALQSELTAEMVAPLRLGQVFTHTRYQWTGAIVGFYELPPASWGNFDAAAEGDSAVRSRDGGRRFYVQTM